jgi:hypothetical protein
VLKVLPEHKELLGQPALLVRQAEPQVPQALLVPLEQVQPEPQVLPELLEILELKVPPAQLALKVQLARPAHKETPEQLVLLRIL